MKCPQCGAQFRVVETRTPDSHPDTQVGRAFRAAKLLVGWYTSDWAVRRRECTRCDAQATTIEVTTEDLIEMFRSDECRTQIGISSRSFGNTGDKGRKKVSSGAS